MGRCPKPHLFLEKKEGKEETKKEYYISGKDYVYGKTSGFAPNTETFSAVHIAPVAAATGRTRSLGGLGGRSRLEFIFSSRLSDESINSRSGGTP